MILPSLSLTNRRGTLIPRTAELVLEYFEQLASQGKTILIVTHDPMLARRATRRVIISDGELVNEDVYHALPTLTHPQMLTLTKMGQCGSLRDRSDYCPTGGG